MKMIPPFCSLGVRLYGLKYSCMQRHTRVRTQYRGALGTTLSSAAAAACRAPTGTACPPHSSIRRAKRLDLDCHLARQPSPYQTLTNPQVLAVGSRYPRASLLAPSLGSRCRGEADTTQRPAARRVLGAQLHEADEEPRALGRTVHGRLVEDLLAARAKAPVGEMCSRRQRVEHLGRRVDQAVLLLVPAGAVDEEAVDDPSTGPP